MDNVEDNKSNRIWELDFIRGLAILGMIFIHLNFSLGEYWGINILSGVPNFAKVVDIVMEYGGLIFILISGICCCFSKNNLNRGLSLFFVAMVVTYVTFMYQIYVDPENIYTVLFGVLHLLAVSMILGHFILKTSKKNIRLWALYFIAAVMIIFLGVYARKNHINIPVLCGYSVDPYFISSDFFPVFPYTGWFILGIFIGKFFYLNGKRIIKSEIAGKYFPIKQICFIGRHSLLIYLLHQPVIFGIIFLLEQFGLLN